jgi:tetratricopeptide (TPR) repeat protein
MTTRFTELLKVPTVMLETSLAVVQTTLETVQGAIGTLTGQEQGPLKGAPLDGPHDVDTAVSDFANRASQIVRYTAFDVREIPGASRDLLEAARRSFGYLDFKDPRNLVLPAQLMLSAGSLAAQSALRGLVLYEMLGPSRIQSLMLDFFYMFTDLPVYVGLEYQDLINKCEERLVVAPDDHRIRYELGETLIKCGLYEQAETELRKITPDSSYYGTALYEASVALYRAGQLDRAARTSVEALDANPANDRAKSWLWMTAQKMGGYPDFVPGNYRIQVRGGYEKTPLEYEDIAARIGLDKTSGGRGTAIFDYDNDGYLDILIAASHGGCNLYHNNGDGTFTDVSIGSGWDGCVNAFALTVGDYDNDGYPDVFASRLGFYAGDCQLYHNNGDGTFTDVTKQAGLEVWGPCFTASWIDYDCDGHLDLFVPNNLGGLFERKTPNRLFHNNGDGTFTEVTEASGLSSLWPTTSGAWGDYDNDGWPDLFLSNGLGRSQLFRNNGNGTFTDVSKEAGIHDLCFGSPAFWWDYDNDGWLDIAQFSWSNHEDVIYTWEHGEGPPDGHPMRVYHNNRDGTFTEVGRELGLSGCFGTMSGNVADLNNDGYMDIVFGNGSPKMDRLEPIAVLQSDGKKFHNITFSAGLPFLGKSHGVNIGDIFGDGRMSILVGAGGVYPADLLTANVYCPKKLVGNYLNVRLVGTKSNRSAIGARVSLEAGGRRQMRQVSGGSNAGCLPFEQHFGLAETAAIDSLEIRWPSGLKQIFQGLPINKTLQFTEGLETWKDVYAKKT